MEDLAKLVGERLRAARQERGWSVGALAETAGIGKGSLSEVENGMRNPTLSTLYALAGALELPLSDLLAGRPGVRVSSPGVEALLLDVRESGGTTVEVYRLVLDAGAYHRSVPHGPGVVEHLLLTQGRARVGGSVRRSRSAPARPPSGSATSPTAMPPSPTNRGVGAGDPLTSASRHLHWSPSDHEI